MLDKVFNSQENLTAQVTVNLPENKGTGYDNYYKTIEFKYVHKLIIYNMNQANEKVKRFVQASNIKTRPIIRP